MIEIEVLFIAIWLMLPAYAANPFAALCGGGSPIDLRISFRGKRLLGDGKTFRGAILGMLAGFVVGIIQIVILFIISTETFMPSFGKFPLVVLLCLSGGAILGDIAESFLKRRLNIKRGGVFPLADQLDFVFGAWLLCFIFAREWFISNFSWQIIGTVLIITPILHFAFNIVGFKMGVKENPW